MQILSKLMKSFCNSYADATLLMVDLGTLDSLMVCCFPDSSRILHIFSLHFLILEFAYLYFSVVLMLQLVLLRCLQKCVGCIDFNENKFLEI